MINKKIKELAAQNLDHIIKIRRELHQYPELGFKEEKTSEIIKRELKLMNIPFTDKIAKTGIVGLIKGKFPGKTVLLRADMDALPILEESNVDFKSKNIGCMHACGHDGHMAGLLGAAFILNELKDQIHGNIKILFQPAEETSGGAEPMIKEKVLENPKVDIAFGCHLWPFKGGSITVKEGDLMSHPCEFQITIFGKGGHASLPELTIDPIVIGAEVVTAIQNIRSRYLSTFDKAVISCTTIHAGDACNIIPDKLIIEGTVRTFSETLSEKIFEKMEQIISGITSSYGAKYDIKVVKLFPPLVNNAYATNLVKNSVKELLGNDQLIEMENPLMGSEDFSYFSQEVPAAFFFVGIKDDQDETETILHHPKFKWDDQRLEISSLILAKTAYDFLEKNK